MNKFCINILNTWFVFEINENKQEHSSKVWNITLGFRTQSTTWVDFIIVD